MKFLAVLNNPISQNLRYLYEVAEIFYAVGVNTMQAGSISFSTALDSAQLEKELARLKRRAFKLEGEIDEKLFNKDAAEKRLRELTEKYKKFAEDRAKLEDGQYVFSEEDIESAKKMYQEIQKTTSETEKLNSDINAAKLSLEYAKKRYGEIEQNKKSLEASENARKETEAAEKRMEQVAEEAAAAVAAAEAQQRLLDIKENAAVADQHILDIQKELSLLVERRKELEAAGVGVGYEEYDNILQRTSEINNELCEYQNNLLRGAAGADEAADGADRMAGAVDRAGTYMDRFLGRVKKLASRVFVFTLITSALRSMRDWLGKAVKSNDEARAAIAKLKGALLTLAQPLVEVIIPAFIQLVNVLTKVVVAIARVVSMLFGKTIEQSAEAAENLYNEQNAIEGVGSAAEKAGKQMASFDEINQLTDNSVASAGIGSGSLEIAPDFSGLTGGVGDGILADIIVNLEDILFKWDNLTQEDVAKKLLGFLFGVAGGIIGWEIGGLVGAAVGFTIGASLSTILVGPFFDGDGTLSPKETLKLLMTGVFGAAGLIIGWTVGGLAGAAIGFTIGASLSMVLSNPVFDETEKMTKKDTENAVMTAIFGTTGAAIGWVLGGLFGAAIGFTLGASLSLVFAGIKNEFSTSFEHDMEALTKDAAASVELSKEIIVRVETRYTALSDVEAEYTDYLNILDRIFELDKIIDKSPGQLALLQSYVDTINNLDLPGLHIDLDPDGKIVQTKEELMKVTEELYKQAQAKAAQEMLVEAWRDYYNAVAESNENMEKLSDATDLVSEKQAALDKLQQESSGLSRFNGEIKKATFELAAAKAAQESYEGALYKSNEAIEKAQTQIGIFEGIVSGATSEITSSANKVESSFSGLSETWKSDMDGAILGLKNSMKNGKPGLVSDANGIGADVMGGMKSGIDSGKESVIGALDAAANGAVSGIKKSLGIHSPSTVMKDIGDNMMQGLANGVKENELSTEDTFSGLWTSIQSVFSRVPDWFKNTFSDAWQSVKDVFSKGGEVFTGIKDGILDGLKTVVNALIDGINKVIAVPFNGINTALKKVKEFEILGASPFSFIKTITIPKIPKLAQGAVIPPNREFLAVLGDQRRGTNIEAPADLIRQIVREEMGGGNQTAALLQAILMAIKEGKTIEVDRREFGRVVHRANAEESRRVGINFAG